jgi:N-acyl-D-amino-acid deacylase
MSILFSRLWQSIFFCSLVILSGPWTLVGAEQPFDLLIQNARIVDGTGNPWFHGDVAVRGDRIVAMGSQLSGDSKLTIEAQGLVVAPGFIDIHSHSDYLLLEDGHAQSKIRQGVTTEILGEGFSAGPAQGRRPGRQVTVGKKTWKWTTLEGYFKALQESGTATNVASYVGIGAVWESVMGKSFDRPTEPQLVEMEKLVKEAMEQGALGFSSQVMMPPGSLATTEEIIRLCRQVKPFGGIYSTHIRNEGTGVFDSVNEAITIGEKAGVPVDIIHLKIADQQYWGRMSEVVALIEQARARGVNVQANVYPYTRGNNNLVSIIPPWAHEGGRDKLLERLKDPPTRKKIKHDIIHGVEGWYNHYTAVGGDWSRMLISGNNRFRGLTMDRVFSLRHPNRQNLDFLEDFMDLLIEEGGSVSTVYAHHTEKDMNLALQQPWCSVGSDGSAYAIEGPLRRGNPHPRNFGTFPRVLGRYVREQKLLTLENGVRKMTSLNAAKVGLKQRGMLKEGYFADITIFDPKQILDQATFTKPFQYPSGIKAVIVNGTIVLQDGTHTDATPGRVLRKTKPPTKP